MPNPLLLRSCTYTPLARTPWGGNRLIREFGKPPPPGVTETPKVGEAWDLSLGPEFPSQTIDGLSLPDVISRDPEGWLGDPLAPQLLLKWIDAEEPLSVQIHPRPDDPKLTPHESGKPEAWYVIASEKGGWIGFGWQPGASPDVIRKAALQGTLGDWLMRIEVEPGDLFTVPPGVPHAIGSGVTLIEPQVVWQGKAGVTYRYFDWNRRYDERGRLDERGIPRPLHLDRALEVTDWNAQGETFLNRSFRRLGRPNPSGPLMWQVLIDRDAPKGALPFDYLQVALLSGCGTMTLCSSGRLAALTVISGHLELQGDGYVIVAKGGQTIALPAHHHPLHLFGKHLWALWASGRGP
ncbi:MAG: class I mannose-6-phosphate isomerase [Sandaracinaceae bacterium]|nr:class I mannose-6-phosphate isomerase [Sandaracinaceae bacterium]